MGLKKFVTMLVAMVIACTSRAQDDTAQVQSPARPVVQTPAPVKKRIADTAQYDYADSALKAQNFLSAKKYRDSVVADSLQKTIAAAKPVVVYDTSTYRRYATHPLLPLTAAPVYMIIDYHKQASKDDLFYLMAGIVFILAFIRAAFSKYFRNLFLLFRQTSLRQKQTRDQLLQDNLASLLTNFLFVISAGLYITLLIRYKGWSDLPFWWLAAGSAIALLLIYLAKYLFLLFTGWVFNTKEAAGSYVFVVFLVNKILGVLLVPFLLILSFGGPELVEVTVTVSVGLVLLLLGYRYWVSFMAIRTKLKVNALHFLLYLCAVELLPLALICKVLMNYFNGSL